MEEHYNVIMQRVEVVEKELEIAKKDIKMLSVRTSETEKAQAVIETKLDNLLEVTGEIKTSLKAIESRPNQWWDKLLGAIIGALAGGFVAWIIK